MAMINSGTTRAAKPPRFLLAAPLLALAAACATNPVKPPPRDRPLSIALSTIGQVQVEESETAGGSDRPTVVVIKDRHPATSGFRRLPDRLAHVNRDNRLALGWLVDHGYSLLGCEMRLGPIEETDDTVAQFETIRKRMHREDYLDRFSVYQPIRHALSWPDRLEVMGVEDPALYDQDVELFRSLLHIRQALQRRDLPEAERSELMSLRGEAMAALREHVAPRGRAAAANLLCLMAERDLDRGILLIGGAHVPAAVRQLRTSGARVYVFTSHSYDLDTSPADASEEDD